ncbi:MAG: Uma2 family endonuclease [Pseudomonadota bacterium]|nr:Uma2 family endonuclease [Pseudomonadota bacterium]
MPFVSVPDYLTGERDGAVRHEYLSGDVYAMAGASRSHNVITFNAAGLLHAGLRPPCQGYVADMKVHIRTPEGEWFYYPDVVVHCAGEAADDYIERPVLSVEVLSPDTARVDKYEKRLNYQRLDSLQEYVLIHQDFREVWVFRRSRQWEKEVYNEGTIDFPSIGLTLGMDDIYNNVWTG